MITLTNYSSGELVLTASDGATKLSRDQANRLILHARMHTVEEFVQAFGDLIPDREIARVIQTTFEKAKNSSERWNLKEKFARLHTLSKGYEPMAGDEKVVEKIEFD